MTAKKDTTDQADTVNDGAGDNTKTDAAAEAVQKVFDAAHEKGYEGTVPDGPPNEAYSLESGPDSPGAYEIQKGDY